MSKNLGMNEVWWVEIEASQSEVGDKEREGMKMEWARRERERKGMKWSGKKEKERVCEEDSHFGGKVFFIKKPNKKMPHGNVWEGISDIIVTFIDYWLIFMVV